MSRARSLKPGFFRNPELSTLSPLTRIFFQGLWCEADRRGVVEDRPKKLKVDILPYDKANVEEMLKNLESAGFIQRYEVDGIRCIHVVNFGKHQNPHRDEKANTLPAPYQHSVDTVPTSDETGTDTALTFNPITDSLNPEPSIPPTPSEGDDDSADEDEKSIYSEDFERFWLSYPLKKSKGAAWRRWQKVRPRPPTDVLIQAVEQQKRSFDWTKSNGEFIPHPSTWLNARGWEDEVRFPPSPIRPPLPPGWTQGKIDEYVVYRQAGKWIPDEAVDVVDAYLAAMNGSIQP